MNSRQKVVMLGKEKNLVNVYLKLLCKNMFPNFFPLPNKANLFSEIKQIPANMDEESENFRNEFRNYLQKVAAYSKSMQDQEEKMILK